MEHILILKRLLTKSDVKKPYIGDSPENQESIMELKNKDAYPKFCIDILDKLTKELNIDLHYHRPEHTIDVVNVCEDYIKRYNIPEHDAHLLRIAAIAHDFGYTQTYTNHEEKGVELITAIMKDHGYPQDDIDKVAGMILATKVPQVPTNLLEKIIADADLDYLGRSDYPELSGGLYKEFKKKGIVSNDEDWLQLQISFLNSHNFHTDYAKKYRERVKKKTLEKLKSQLPIKSITGIGIRKKLRNIISNFD